MSENKNEKQQEIDTQKEQDEQIRETGQLTLDQNKRKHRIELLTIIGEVEGHDSAPSQSKTTKYEHVLPKLALIEDDKDVDGLLILLNTVGGDVEAGTCNRGNDRIFEYSHGFSCAGRRALDRSADGGVGRLFFCSAECNDGDSSGALQWDVYRCGAVLPEYRENSGPHYGIYCGTFRYDTGTARGTDAGYQSACQRCRNDA